MRPELRTAIEAFVRDRMPPQPGDVVVLRRKPITVTNFSNWRSGCTPRHGYVMLDGSHGECPIWDTLEEFWADVVSIERGEGS